MPTCRSGGTWGSRAHGGVTVVRGVVSGVVQAAALGLRVGTVGLRATGTGTQATGTSQAALRCADSTGILGKILLPASG